jgi:hypothetical protein
MCCASLYTLADAEPFCGGMAHAGMARMARAVWSVAGDDVCRALAASPPGTELILTGHSLGAGVASLLTLMLHEEASPVIELASRVRCFAYAPPPVFFREPRGFPHPAEACIAAFVHADDCVPFLSVDSGRRLLAGLRAVETHTNRQPPAYYAPIALGRRPADAELVRVAQAGLSGSGLSPMELAPPLRIPAAAVVWVRPLPGRPVGRGRRLGRRLGRWLRSGSGWLGRRWRRWRGLGEYDALVCSPERLSEQGVGLSLFMLTDHFPDGYERALSDLSNRAVEVLEEMG